MVDQERELWLKLSQFIDKSELASELTFLKYKKGFSPFERVKSVVLMKKILLASYRFISSDPSWYRSTWDWKSLWQLVDNKSPEIKWLSMQCIRVLCDLPDQFYFDWLQKNFSTELERKLRLEYNYIYKDYRASDSPPQKFSTEDTVDIFGIQMVKFGENVPNSHSRLIAVPSVKANLIKAALALSENRPIIIEGPLGCGKTSLIEHISELTGRCKPPELTKIQIGNQVDGKLLVGTYCCTDTIGEFIWKPGPLTEALMKGHWLVFEDIDCASADVLTIMLSVIKSRSLSSIPGCYVSGATIDPRFRVFFTRRVINGQTEAFSNADKEMIAKMCEKISIKNPNRNELKTIIAERWPKLVPNISVISEIYKIVSVDSSAMDLFESVESFSNRKASLRDFLKWCQRISTYVDSLVLTNEQRKSCFLDANDCFLANIADKGIRSSKSQDVGVKLHISRELSRQILTNHVPEISVKSNLITIGRTNLTALIVDKHPIVGSKKAPFSKTNASLCLLERISCSIKHNEPVLLVGETGTGKTSTVQYLCNLLNRQLTVINMNQQSDTCDLLGGYKPVELSFLLEPIRDEFDQLFNLSFCQQENAKFLRSVATLFRHRSWDKFLDVILHVQASASRGKSKTLKNRSSEEQASILKRWDELGLRINKLKSSAKEVPLVFTYIEGTLVKAMRKGEWILLDEINLAESETLQCLSSILESDDGNILLLDKADGEPIKKHPDFRLFACMNPSTDIGKRDLPLGIRNRFTEFYVEELESASDLRSLVSTYLQGAYKTSFIEQIVQFYLAVRKEAKISLKDAIGGSPNFTLRTLCRALQVAVNTSFDASSSLRALYEAFCLAFLTQLDTKSYHQVESMILKTVLKVKKVESIVHMNLAKPKSDDYIFIDGYWIAKGSNEPITDESYILTNSVTRNLRDVTRIISLGRSYPILIQGETSVGKTSMINYLAKRSGNVCLRVNNHEHTDLQEYIGSYTADDKGKLVFKEGILVEAMRKGYWIILDELNLASTEVLESLNRVLDDNRELFIPETQETVKAHPKFLLFATQNPPGHYGGRKILSRAFRNRFIELHFDEIPANELEIILQKRCLLPPSYAKKMVVTLIELRNRLHQSVSLSFAGKHGGVTLRDLFRWGERYRLFAKDYSSSQPFYNWDQHLANEGYMLLAGRSRNEIEEQVIRDVLSKTFNIKNFIPEDVYETLFNQYLSSKVIPQEFHHLFWTSPLKRLATLVFQALKYNEPVLLVGETGCGKTTICQLFAALINKPLFSVNCHMHSESSDFLGSLRPVRQHEEGDTDSSQQRLFEWVDGPLVKAMQIGSVFLIDEISLADDSVLERLNSVIEPERLLMLAEKGFIGKGDSNLSDLVIKAHPDFHLIATMNPGGDYGKKELSPALRNRFTEIWCYSSTELNDLNQIISHNLTNFPVNLKENIVKSLCSFLKWLLSKTKESGINFTSIRDVLSLVNFISIALKADTNQEKALSPVEAIHHAVHLVFLDSMGSSGSLLRDAISSKKECESTLNSILNENFGELTPSSDSLKLIQHKKSIGIVPFFISKGNHSTSPSSMYIFNSPTVASNAQRLLRAMQLSKPILIEGVPGVGKTSLVQSLAKAANFQVIRINLSEQTDVSDLFGADLPVEGCEGQFSWRDGPLLQALKSDSCWVLLDELNLASQSVLEGLNACLDHRGEIFIPELGKAFSVSKQSTRIFACQNPHAQGGDRKGLPKSFLNRFTVIHVASLTPDDLKFIVSNVYQTLPSVCIDKMVTFNDVLSQEISSSSSFGRRGSPWEFNLRDIFRWCQLVTSTNETEKITDDQLYQSMKIIYVHRFRTREDIDLVEKLFESTFDYKIRRESTCFNIYPDLLQVGRSFLPRTLNGYKGDKLLLLHGQVPLIEALMKCVEMNWMALIVGSSRSGKSTLVHLLSQLVGANLKTIIVNSEMDTIELLGGFNQKDVIHDIERIESTIEPLVWNHVSLKTIDSDYGSAREKLKQWLNYRNSSLCETPAQCLDKLNRLKTIIEEITSNLPQSNNLSERVTNLIDYVKNKTSLSSRGSFQWIDSILVDALREGHWLLIDDTNLCPASVLDRLNGLLEPDGELILNEQGCVNGIVPVVHPHPNFRLFLTIDPKNGELSRAMRNRGVEIFVLPQFNEADVRSQMINVGLTDKSLQEALLAYHHSLIDSNQHLTDEQLNGSYLIQLASHLCLESKCGNDIKQICADHTELETFLNALNNQKLELSKEEELNIEVRDFKTILGDILVFKVTQELSVIPPDMINRNFLNSDYTNQDLVRIVSSLGLIIHRSNQKDISYRCDFIAKKVGVSVEPDDDQSKPVLFSLPCSSSAYNYLPKDMRFNPIAWENFTSQLDGIEMASLQRNLNRRALKLFNWMLTLIQQYFSASSPISLLKYPSERKMAIISSFQEILKIIPSIIENLRVQCESIILDISPRDEELYDLKAMLLWIHQLTCLMTTDCGSINDTNPIFEKLLILWVVVFEKLRTHQSIKFNFESPLYAKFNSHLGLDQKTSVEKFAFKKHLSSSFTLYKDEQSASLFIKTLELSRLLIRSEANLLINPHIKSCLNGIVEVYENLFIGNYDFPTLTDKLSQVEVRIREKVLPYDNDSNSRDDADERSDKELAESFAKPIDKMSQLVEPLNYIDLFWKEICHLKNIEQRSSVFQCISDVCLSPMHIFLVKCLPLDNSLRKYKLFYHLLDYQNTFTCPTIYSLLAHKEASGPAIDDASETSEWSKFGYCFSSSPFFTLLSSKLLNSRSVMGTIDRKINSIERLKCYISSNFDSLTDPTVYNFSNHHLDLVVELVNNLKSTIDDFLSHLSPKYKSSFSELYLKVSSCTRETTNHVQGSALILFGSILTHLWSPTMPIDPLQKWSAKLSHYREELDFLQEELAAHNRMSIIQTGQSMLPDSEHPHVAQALGRKSIVLKKIEKLEARQGHRPTPSQYQKLRFDVVHFLSTLLPLEKVFRIVERLDRSDDKIVGELNNLHKSIAHFVDHIHNTYPLYANVTTEMLLGMSITMYGLNMSSHEQLTRQTINIYNFRINEINLFEKLKSTFSLPTLDPVGRAVESIDIAALEGFKRLTSRSQKGTIDLINLLYKSALAELKIAAHLTIIPGKEILITLFKVIDTFLIYWLNEEEKRKLKKCEEESLFQYKAKVHPDELPEELVDEMEMKKRFPTFENEFHEFIKNHVNTDQSDQSYTESGVKKRSNTGNETIQENDIVEICDLHKDVLSSLLRKQVQSTNLIDIFKPLTYRYQVSTEIVDIIGPVLGRNLDTSSIQSSWIMCRLFEKSLSLSGNNQLPSTSISFNFYKDAKHDELRECFTLLEPIKKRILNELLPQFPGNPMLHQLLLIIEKLYNLDVNSPLAKIVTGLEVLLRSAEDWEQMAHRKIKLSDQLASITSLVIKWRKMELKFWSTLLDSVHQEIENKQISRYWFHFYSMIHSILTIDERRDGDNNEEVERQLLNLLQRFFEESTVGQFGPRLRLLRNFIDHQLCIDSRRSQLSLFTILVNTYKYYSQFEATISEEINKIRKPIEKELKEFIKIMRWDDGNFWTLKSKVEKSHKTLHRLSKKYDKELAAPVITFFQLSNSEADGKILTISSSPEAALAPLEPIQCSELTVLPRSHQLIVKVARYSKRSKTLTKPIREYIKQMNFRIDDIIEGIKEMSNLKVDPQIKEKEKYEKQVKSINNMKRQSFSTLLKNLGEWGISFKKGIEMYNSFDFNEVMSSCSPFEPDWGISLSDEQSHHIDKYFYSILLRYSQFRSSLTNPSSDLKEIRNVFERLKGTVGFMLNEIISSKRNIFKQLYVLKKLKDVTEVISKCCDRDNRLTSSVLFHHWLSILSKHIVSLQCLLLQVKELPLETSKNHSSESSSIFDRLLENLNNMSSVFATSLPVHLKSSIITSSSETELEQIWVQLATLSLELKSYIGPIKAASGTVLQHLIDLCDQVSDDAANFKNRHLDCPAKLDKRSIENVFQASESFLVSILSHVQTLFKSLSDQTTDTGDPSMDKIYSHLSDNLLNRVNLSTVQSKVEQIITSISSSVDIEDEQSLTIQQDVVVHIHSYLERYVNLVTYITQINLSSFRTRCKLLYLLLGLFTDLCKQGFCLPPPWQDDDEKTVTKDKLKDLTDAGLGKGEGEKDVSNKIESEDQLDEALPVGGQKDEDKDDNDKDIKDEKNGIEMSEDFDAPEFGPDDEDENKDDDDNEEEDGDDLDKKMGDIDESEGLDDKMWGKDDEEEEEEEDENDLDDDGDEGGEEMGDNRLVANDDNQGIQERSNGKDKSKEDNEEDEGDDEEINEQKVDDDYEGERQDPYKQNVGKDEEEDKQRNKDGEDFPDDMELDANEKGSEDGDEGEDEEKEDDESNDQDENEEIQPDVLPENNEDQSGDKNENDEGDGDGKVPEEVLDKEEEKTDDNEENEADEEEKEREDDQSAPDNRILDTEQAPLDSGADSKLKPNAQVDPFYQQEERIISEGASEMDDNDNKDETEGTGSCENPTQGQANEGKLKSSTIHEDSANQQTTTSRPNQKKRGHKSTSETPSKATKKQKILERYESDEAKGEKSEVNKMNEIDSSLVQHCAENEESVKDVIDIAEDSDAAKSYPENRETDQNDEEGKHDNFIEPEEMEVDESNGDDEIKRKADKSLGNRQRQKQDEQSVDAPGNEDEDEMIDTKGDDYRKTLTVPRGPESQFYNRYDPEINQLSSWFDKLYERIEKSELLVDVARKDAWNECEKTVGPLVYELCQQLQLVLEPMKASKMKGDYRTGKRLNMRKVIEYIASSYKKDKIWLRRTMPNKRQYQIILAIDDSSSMLDNQSKRMAFESIALLGKSLSLIEAGELAVMSFGEQAQLLHSFGEPFTDSAGSKLLSHLNFGQKHTRIGSLLEFAAKYFVQCSSRKVTQGCAVSQLLLIISDGRGLNNEGEDLVRQAVRNMQNLHIFTVFLVMDSSTNENSILDIKLPVFDSSGNCKLENYMDKFPFPFYIILKNISCMPRILGEALRKWLEMVTQS